MNIELTNLEYRRLLDMVYIGNWILNSIRGDDRFADYDIVESKIFSYCHDNKMSSLVTKLGGVNLPSDKFVEGGIHEAIADYETSIFFSILAEELALRDMDYPPIGPHNFEELNRRMDEYIDEFEENGVTNVSVDR